MDPVGSSGVSGFGKIASDDHRAAVDHELGAGDVRGFIAGKEQRGIDDVTRFGEAPSGIAGAVDPLGVGRRTACIGVFTKPGWMQLARTPCANCTASERVSEITAPLLQCRRPGARVPENAETEPMLTIAPPPARISSGTPYLHTQTIPLRLIPMT